MAMWHTGGVGNANPKEAPMHKLSTPTHIKFAIDSTGRNTRKVVVTDVRVHHGVHAGWTDWVEVITTTAPYQPN
jgi:hypothetical protein